MNRDSVHSIGLTPLWLALATTFQCDSRCITCNLWKSVDRTMMNPDNLQHSIADCFFDGIKSVAFFGGEPTRNNKLPELVNIVVNRFPQAEISVVTNGIDETRIRDILKIISKKITKNLLVCVSVNGMADRHDYSKGISGAYNNALRVLETAKTFFTKKPRISLTLLPDFTNEIEHVGWLAQQFGTDISLRCAVSGSYFKGSVNTTWSGTQLKRLREEITKIPEDLLASPKFCKALLNFLESDTHVNCTAHRQSLVVSPSLMTSICHNQPNMCYLGDIPRQWGKAKWWYEAGNVDCFKGQECFVDGPYAIGL